MFRVGDIPFCNSLQTSVISQYCLLHPIQGTGYDQYLKNHLCQHDLTQNYSGYRALWPCPCAIHYQQRLGWEVTGKRWHGYGIPSPTKDVWLNIGFLFKKLCEDGTVQARF